MHYLLYLFKVLLILWNSGQEATIFLEVEQKLVHFHFIQLWICFVFYTDDVADSAKDRIVVTMSSIRGNSLTSSLENENFH
jgi:hypothetical protein